MRTCGNCGVTTCTDRERGRIAACPDWKPREPTELEKAQWWWVGWRRKGLVYKADCYKSGQRLEAEIRENAGKGE